MSTAFIKDFRAIPDIALINITADFFELALKGNKFISNYLEMAIKELEKRNPEYVNIAHRKTLKLPFNDLLVKEKFEQHLYESKELSIIESLERINNEIAFSRVIGDSMIEANILDGDIVILEKSNNYNSGDIVLLELNGNRFIKRIIFDVKSTILKSENKKYNDYLIKNEDNLKIIGKIIKNLRYL